MVNHYVLDKVLDKIKETKGIRTQSKIHGGFVTFYPIHFGHLNCGTH